MSTLLLHHFNQFLPLLTRLWAPLFERPRHVMAFLAHKGIVKVLIMLIEYMDLTLNCIVQNILVSKRWGIIWKQLFKMNVKWTLCSLYVASFRRPWIKNVPCCIQDCSDKLRVWRTTTSLMWAIFYVFEQGLLCHFFVSLPFFFLLKKFRKWREWEEQEANVEIYWIMVEGRVVEWVLDLIAIYNSYYLEANQACRSKVDIFWGNE